MGAWSEVVVDLLSIIDEHSELLADKIRLRCVCKQWQSLGPVSLHLLQPQPPCLLLPYANGSACGLYHPFQNKVFEVDLPEAGEKVFKGSDHGWVVAAHKDGSITVFNPLSRAHFPLPPRYKFPDVNEYRPDKVREEYSFKLYPEFTESAYDVRNNKLDKIALSCSPNSTDFRAVAMYGEYNKLAYCKLGDEEWHGMVEIDTDLDELGHQDITFFDGKLYAMPNDGELMVCDDVVSCPKLRKFDPLHQPMGYISQVTLANAPDGLMAVYRSTDCREVRVTPTEEYEEDYNFTHKTKWFKVFKLDTSSLSWARMESLGSRVLFLGLAAQWCIDSPPDDDVTNQIYFSSHLLRFPVQEVQDCFDNGIYSFKDKTFKPLGYECNPKIVWPSPIWAKLNPY